MKTSTFLSPQALERPLRTIHAADVFHDHACAIARACAEASAAEAVVAVVTPDFVFDGLWVFPSGDLVRRVPEVEYAEGWSLLFSAEANVAEIKERCVRLAHCSFKRWEALRRWTSKHEWPGSEGEDG